MPPPEGGHKGRPYMKPYPTGEIAHRLLGRDGFLSWASFGDFSHRNLIESLVG